uniref:FAD dependent oxidoreductase domain-containing protein n=1 Tax=Coccolithus braarudii TaxID=221442 RepID=A0A7S0L2V9_9EUKA|mmetsp:Transcript_1466/g.3141  ORF Transcript_1466/g.3141 Transcript_1466/m.3141 type:complete len:152 (+) Transcript_1466:3-458(+)
MRTLPGLRRVGLAGTYAGLRPGTDASPDYQIGLSMNKTPCGERAPWITVGGIRSTGLTASLGIASHVAGLCNEALRLSGGVPVLAERPPIYTTPLPPVEAIVASYHERGDGSVVIGDDTMEFGAHYVTHPLTRAGFARLAITQHGGRDETH